MTRRRHMMSARALLLGAVLLLLAACGDDEPDPTLAQPTGGQTGAGETTGGETTGGTGETTGTGQTTGETNGGQTTGGETTGGETTGGETTGGETTGGETTGGETTGVISQPEVLQLTTAQGPTEGGTDTVVLTVGFAADFRDTLPSVTFAGAPATGVEAISRGVVKVKTPAGQAGPVEVAVAVTGEKGILEGGFTYLTPDALPTDYVKVRMEGQINADGVPLHIPITLEVVGNAQPAAVSVRLTVDLVQLPLAAPTALEGDLHGPADKTLTINTAINGGVKALILGKNRNVLTSGTILTLIYNIPPTTPWSLTPLTIEAQAVDPKGAPIPVITESGWLGINEGSP